NGNWSRHCARSTGPPAAAPIAWSDLRQKGERALNSCGCLNGESALLSRAPSRGGTFFAGIAQLVEQLICNQQVVGSNPSAGSSPELTKAGVLKPCFGGSATKLRLGRHPNF